MGVELDIAIIYIASLYDITLVPRAAGRELDQYPRMELKQGRIESFYRTYGVPDKVYSQYIPHILAGGLDSF